MEIIKTIKEMQAWSDRERLSGHRIGLVPTMGYLHQGHLGLVRQAKSEADAVVVSIFVNPKQFGPGEDLAVYPRDMDRDLSLLSPLGVDVVFSPEPEEMYPPDFQTRVEVTEVTRGLCGACRPTFFSGVATVVLKLLNIAKPHLVFFGEKDYQQLVTVRRMVRDLSLDIEVRGHPTVRENDGLAMSSRNTYLSDEERQSALSLSKSLNMASEMAANGERDAGVILQAVKERIEANPLARVQYAQLVDPEILTEVDHLNGPALLALAVFVGRTRLIDNIILH